MSSNALTGYDREFFCDRQVKSISPKDGLGNNRRRDQDRRQRVLHKAAKFLATLKALVGDFSHRSQSCSISRLRLRCRVPRSKSNARSPIGIFSILIDGIGGADGRFSDWN